MNQIADTAFRVRGFINLATDPTVRVQTRRLVEWPTEDACEPVSLAARMAIDDFMEDR